MISSQNLVLWSAFGGRRAALELAAVRVGDHALARSMASALLDLMRRPDFTLDLAEPAHAHLVKSLVQLRVLNRDDLNSLEALQREAS